MEFSVVALQFWVCGKVFTTQIASKDVTLTKMNSCLIDICEYLFAEHAAEFQADQMLSEGMVKFCYSRMTLYIAAGHTATLEQSIKLVFDLDMLYQFPT